MKLSKRITRMQVLRQVGLWKKSRRAVRLKKPAKRKLRIIDDEVLRQPNKLKEEESDDSDEDRQKKNELKHEESGDSDEDRQKKNELKHEESGDSDDRQMNELKHEESGDSDDRQMNELKHEQKFRRFRRCKYSPADLYDRERDGIYDERIEEYRAYAKTAIDVFNQGGCAKYSVVDIHTFSSSHIGGGASLKNVTFTAKRDKDRVEDAKSFIGGIIHHYDGRREFSFVRFLKPWLL